MAATPPPLPVKTRKTGSTPVIVSGHQKRSSCSIESTGNVVKIRLNQEPPATAPNNYRNAVRINISSEDMILKNHDYFYNYVGPSGQSSPSETPDSGTCSDADGSTPPPLPEKKCPREQRGPRGKGVQEGSDDEISCDSLNSSELDGSETKSDPGVTHTEKTDVLESFRRRAERKSLSRASSLGVVEERTYEDRAKPRHDRIHTDSFYKFHLNENDFDAPPEPGTVDYEDTFAGRKYVDGDASSKTIRSAKGTIRGVKNRVRAGIATFLQINATKTWQEKEAGKIVVYTTTMGIVRQTAQRCLTVRNILRTNMVKFTEKDAFMSKEVQAELRERMGSVEVQLPQVFVEGQHIGDADTIEKLNEIGELRKILKPYKSPEACTTCEVCGGYRLLPCGVCNGSKKSVHRNHFTTELVALKCMNCDEVGLVKCYAC